jgi:DNA-binding transcriptional regulator YiaG
MPNLASLLKSEISRLSRREIRKEVQPLRKTAAAYRREIAALKRVVASLERRTKTLAKSAPVQNSSAQISDEKPIRFVSKGLVSLRRRLGLSAPQLATLLKVSTQSVYNWEHKKASPRKEQVVAIAALRLVGKKEAHQRLQEASRPIRRKAKKRARRKG